MTGSLKRSPDQTSSGGALKLIKHLKFQRIEQRIAWSGKNISGVALSTISPIFLSG